MKEQQARVHHGVFGTTAICHYFPTTAIFCDPCKGIRKTLDKSFDFVVLTAAPSGSFE